MVRTVVERRAHGHKILVVKGGEESAMFGSRKNEAALPVVERGACRHSVLELGAVHGSSVTLASSGGSGSSPGSSWTRRRFARCFVNVLPLRMQSPRPGGTAQLYWDLRSGGQSIWKPQHQALERDGFGGQEDSRWQGGGKLESDGITNSPPAPTISEPTHTIFAPFQPPSKVS